jgi:hypothetical protein
MPPQPRFTANDLAAIGKEWEQVWPKALEVWSKYTRLRPPTLCLTQELAEQEGLTGSFAMIRLQDQAIIVNLPAVVACGVTGFALEVLAHEIGHHVLAPATLTEHARMIARMRHALPTVERHAPMVANLYTDLLINDRLQRSANLRLAEVYRTLGTGSKTGAVWTLYMRIYEILWSLERGAFGGGKTDDRVEGDAWLGARLLRSYARDWLDGSGRFAALLLPHLLEDHRSAETIEKWLDTRNAAAGGNPSGLAEAEAEEREGAIHPAQDPDLADVPADGDAEGDHAKPTPPRETSKNQSARGQAREPFDYGEILRAAGVSLSDHEAAVRYYRERARPHLVPFPSRETPESTDPLPEGLEPWDFGHSLDAADWFQSVLQSPRIIPGMTTVQRVWGTSEGHLPRRVPLDLDLYVDSSGSMPNPQQLASYPALAGAILCLSAFRAGARVQATLWSGKNQVTSTKGFVRDEEAVLRVLTGYYGGATAFPIHALRDTYASRRLDAHPAHILVISDDGVSTLFDKDERGDSGWDVAAIALRRAGGGGTFVLNLPEHWDQAARNTGPLADIRKARDTQGWHVHRVATWDDLIEFARQFSRLRYGRTVQAGNLIGRPR